MCEMKQVKIKGKRKRVVKVGLCTAEYDFDVYAIGNLYPHELTKSTLVRIEIDEPLVDAHLPAVNCLTALTIG